MAIGLTVPLDHAAIAAQLLAGIALVGTHGRPLEDQHAALAEIAVERVSDVAGDLCVFVVYDIRFDQCFQGHYECKINENLCRHNR
jgi:hypothetical protein